MLIFVKSKVKIKKKTQVPDVRVLHFARNEPLQTTYCIKKYILNSNYIRAGFKLLCKYDTGMKYNQNERQHNSVNIYYWKYVEAIKNSNYFENPQSYRSVNYEVPRVKIQINEKETEFHLTITDIFLSKLYFLQLVCGGKQILISYWWSLFHSIIKWATP